MMKKNFCIPLLLMALITMVVPGCIKNDIPYPRIPQMILALVAEGESKSAYIDSISYVVNVYLDEDTDIENVRFSEYRISEDAESDPNLLEGTYDLSKPVYVTLSRFQEYTWEIVGHQDIERYFVVDGQVGESAIDPVACRVIVYVAEGTDLHNLTLKSVKLGPVGITTMTPDLKPGPLDLAYPLRVEVTAHDRTEIWTIYAETLESTISTTEVDAWSRVIWAYGTGLADAEKGFEYKKTSDSEWIRVPDRYVTQNQGSVFCYIPGLEPLTEYSVRAVQGEDIGNAVTVTTESTADIPNGDFLGWSQTSNKMWNPWAEGEEPYWDTGNAGSMTMGVNLTTPSDDTPTGSGKAARCQTQFVGIGVLGKLGAGSIFTGSYLRTEGTNGVLGFGRPWKLRPTKLKGYFRYEGKPIDYVSKEYPMSEMAGRPDTCHIYVALTNWSQPYEIRTKESNRQLFDKNADYIIAYGELCYSGTMSEYQPFEIELKYNNTYEVPTYLQITCAASKYGDYFTGGNGSTLYVDQLSFDWDY